jgi:hypothetical protein
MFTLLLWEKMVFFFNQKELWKLSPVSFFQNI